MDPKQRCSTPRLLLSFAVGAAILAGSLNTATADDAPAPPPPVTVGVGLQTNFYACEHACIYSPGSPTSSDNSVDGFALDTIRLYVNGSITDTIKMTFNTEYTGSTTDTVIVFS